MTPTTCNHATTHETTLATAKDRCAHAHDPFEILSTCHEHLLGKLEVLAGVAHDLRDAPALDDGHLARLCDVLTMMAVAIPIHSADEEQTLFPALRARAPFAGVAHTPMDCMESEHEGHQRLMRDLQRSIVQRDVQAVRQAALAIVAEYRQHIQKEEDVLFPMAKQLLAGETRLLADMAAAMRRRRVSAGLLSC